MHLKSHLSKTRTYEVAFISKEKNTILFFSLTVCIYSLPVHKTVSNSMVASFIMTKAVLKLAIYYTPCVFNTSNISPFMTLKTSHNLASSLFHNRFLHSIFFFFFFFYVLLALCDFLSCNDIQFGNWTKTV